MTPIPAAVPMDLVEHVAVYASERADAELEQICDQVLAGQLRPEPALGQRIRKEDRSMTLIQKCALRDAESDYADRTRSDEDWLRYCGRVRAGDVLGPAVVAIEAAGLEPMCRSWGVSLLDWDTRSGAWLREYNGTYCSAIEVLVRRAELGGIR